MYRLRAPVQGLHAVFDSRSSTCTPREPKSLVQTQGKTRKPLGRCVVLPVRGCTRAFTFVDSRSSTCTATPTQAQTSHCEPRAAKPNSPRGREAQGPKGLGGQRMLQS